MNSSQEFQNTLHETAESVEHQARRDGRAVADTAQSLSDKFDPGAFFSEALTWVEAILTPQNRALAGRVLNSVAAMPRSHPLASTLLAVGSLCMAWRNAKDTAGRDAVENYAAEQADKLRDLSEEARRSANRGARFVAASGRDIGTSISQSASLAAEQARSVAKLASNAATSTVDQFHDVYEEACESLNDGMDQLADGARRLRKDAEAGYGKAKGFAKEEPALAIVGGVALAIGALLLVRSSCR